MSEDSNIETVKLKNGARLPEVFVSTTMLNIKSLIEQDPGKAMPHLLALYELGKMAHDKNHKVFDKKSEEILKGLALLDKNGNMSIIVRDVVASAITFKNGGDMPIVSSPIEGEEVGIIGG
jgi:hypothetical protein